MSITPDPQADIAREAEAHDQQVAIVEKTWEAGDLCGDCQYCHTWMEHHGPGLNEPMGECLVLDQSMDPAQCPGVVAWLKSEVGT
jgi:hypothetical protein